MEASSKPYTHPTLCFLLKKKKKNKKKEKEKKAKKKKKGRKPHKPCCVSCHQKASLGVGCHTDTVAI